MIIHTKYNPPKHPGVENDEPSLTQQHFQKECDVNEMLRKFGASGELPSKEGAFYADALEIQDFRSSFDAVLNIQAQFDQLPSSCREKFHNSPQLFLEYIDNPHNAQGLADLGITVVPVAPLDGTGTTDTNSIPEA